VHLVVGIPLQLPRDGAIEIAAPHDEGGDDRDDGDEDQQRAEGLREGLQDDGQDRDRGDDGQHATEGRQQDPMHLPSMSVPGRRGAADRVPQTDLMQLPDEVLDLLRHRGITYLATLMPDGSPQLTQTWVDTDGEFVIINTVDGHQKVRNIRRDPRVAVTVADPDDPSDFVQLRGEVVRETTDGAAEHINLISERYTGRPYPWYGGRDQVRLMLYIRVDKVGALRR